MRLPCLAAQCKWHNSVVLIRAQYRCCTAVRWHASILEWTVSRLQINLIARVYPYALWELHCHLDRMTWRCLLKAKEGGDGLIKFKSINGWYTYLSRYGV